jgi:hypothetical protein
LITIALGPDFPLAVNFTSNQIATMATVPKINPMATIVLPASIDGS